MTLFDAAPAPSTLDELRGEARRCQACPLYAHATQTVVGEGPADAAVMLVGEQPGDHEDVQGQPFVGPAGKVLRQLLDEVGLPVERCYVTNAVKHFKFDAAASGASTNARTGPRPPRATRGWPPNWRWSRRVVVALGVVGVVAARGERCAARRAGAGPRVARPGPAGRDRPPVLAPANGRPRGAERAPDMVLGELRLAMAVAGEV